MRGWEDDGWEDEGLRGRGLGGRGVDQRTRDWEKEWLKGREVGRTRVERRTGWEDEGLGGRGGWEDEGLRGRGVRGRAPANGFTFHELFLSWSDYKSRSDSGGRWFFKKRHGTINIEVKNGSCILPSQG